MTNFLISSAGRRGALVQILQAIARADGGTVTAIDVSPLSSAGHLADHFEIVPRVDSDAFVDAVLDTCVRREIDVVIPTIDPEIAIYAHDRKRFTDFGIDVWVPSVECAQLGFDKWAFHEWLVGQGLPTVETHEAFDARWKGIVGPVVAKPRYGSSSVGVIFHRTVDGFSSGLPADYLVQPAATGLEMTVDFAMKDGQFLGAVPRQRLETRSGEVSKSVTMHIPEAEGIVERIAMSLPGMYGIGNVQLFFDEASGGVTVIELNPRFGGGYPLTHAAGADFVTAMLADAPDGSRSAATWDHGVTMLRYDDAVFVRELRGRS